MADLRDDLAASLTGFLKPEQVELLINEILAINKRASAEFTCKHCKKRQMQWTDIPDAKAVADALGSLLNQAFGRPSEESVKSEPIQFRRLTILDDDEEVQRALRLAEENRRRFVSKRPEDAANGSGASAEGLPEAEVDPDSESNAGRG